MKKILALLGLTSTISLSGCSGKTKVNPDKQKYEVGIAQLVTHPALDAATAGFKEKLTSLLQGAGREVSFIENNAAGDSALCPTITTDLVSKDVDLILANATPCLTAAYAATSYIPILGTSITDYGAALGIEFKDGKSGKNVSGTSDLAPLDQQASEMVKLLPSANKIGILYCSSEANSKFQVDEITKQLTALGKTVTARPFTDSSDLKAFAKNPLLMMMQSIFQPTIPLHQMFQLLMESLLQLINQFMLVNLVSAKVRALPPYLLIIIV